MCNACGFYCCASDQFSGCGCDGCPCSGCWSDDDDQDDYDDDEPEMRAVEVTDELHQILGEALKKQ